MPTKRESFLFWGLCLPFWEIPINFEVEWVSSLFAMLWLGDVSKRSFERGLCALFDEILWTEGEMRCLGGETHPFRFFTSFLICFS
jgi:hypothetical protein